MGRVIRWGGDPEDVTVEMSGPFDFWEVAAVFAELRQSPAYRSDIRILLDYRATDWSNVTGEDIRSNVDGITGEPGDRRRIAVVVDRKLAYGLLRVMDAYLDGRTGVTANYFYDAESARAWLRSE